MLRLFFFCLDQAIPFQKNDRVIVLALSRQAVFSNDIVGLNNSEFPRKQISAPGAGAEIAQKNQAAGLSTTPVFPVVAE